MLERNTNEVKVPFSLNRKSDWRYLISSVHFDVYIATLSCHDLVVKDLGSSLVCTPLLLLVGIGYILSMVFASDL